MKGEVDPYLTLTTVAFYGQRKVRTHLTFYLHKPPHLVFKTISI